MASQEFLASFAVDIDEGGVSRLQSVLEENRDLANEDMRDSLDAVQDLTAGFYGVMVSGTLTITDSISGFRTICTGVSLQKAPDRTWDRTATNVSYTLLAATITEQ